MSQKFYDRTNYKSRSDGEKSGRKKSTKEREEAKWERNDEVGDDDDDDDDEGYDDGGDMVSATKYSRAEKRPLLRFENGSNKV